MSPRFPSPGASGSPPLTGHRRRRAGHGPGVTGLLGGCTSTPQAVLNVPGSYTADFTPSLLNPSGVPSATVLMCLDQASAVRLDFSQGAGYKLDWNGVIYSNWFGLPYLTAATSVTLPVLQPGCATLGFGLTPSFTGQPRPWNLTVTATKV